MPLITGCAHAHPTGLAIPAVPNPLLAANLAPVQGDHLFGDVLGSVETALQTIFGGGAVWLNRMGAYNSTMRNCWEGLGVVDFGHGALPPIVTRQGAAEPDEHSHMFGHYSARLQWTMCEIVCTGFGAHGEERRIGGYGKKWKNEVLARFDDLLNHLVDDTALRFYIATPAGTRNANAALVRHTAISLAAANVYVLANAGPGRARVQTVLTSYATLRSAFEGVLGRFEGNIKTFNSVNDTWT